MGECPDRFPKRTEVTVLGPDKKKEFEKKFGFIIHEKIGVGAYSASALTQLQLVKPGYIVIDDTDEYYFCTFD